MALSEAESCKRIKQDEDMGTEITIENAVPLSRHMIIRDFAHGVVVCSMINGDTKPLGVILLRVFFDDRYYKSRVDLVDANALVPTSRNSVAITYVPGECYHVAVACMDRNVRVWKVSPDFTVTVLCCVVQAISTSVCVAVSRTWLVIASGPFLAAAPLATEFAGPHPSLMADYSMFSRPIHESRASKRSYICRMGPQISGNTAIVARFECMNALSVEMDYFANDCVHIVDVQSVFKVCVSRGYCVAPVPVFGHDEKSRALVADYQKCLAGQIHAGSSVAEQLEQAHKAALKLSGYRYNNLRETAGTLVHREGIGLLDWRGSIGSPDVSVAWTYSFVRIIGVERGSPTWERSLDGMDEIIGCDICGDNVVVLSRTSFGIVLCVYNLTTDTTNMIDMGSFQEGSCDVRVIDALRKACTRRYVRGKPLYRATSVLVGSYIIDLQTV